MRAKRENQQAGRRSGGIWQTAAQRGGSVLIVVLWLMALLWVLGLFFILFATTEQNASQFYSDAAKVDNRCGVDPDILWDWALRQLIVGPKTDEDNDNDPTSGTPDAERESGFYVFDSRRYGPDNHALNIGRHSILAHVLGTDLQAYNGEGINLIASSAEPGMAFVDQDYDGFADVDQSLLDVNFSTAAVRDGSENAIDIAGQPVIPPSTDVGYTSPDINALFLSYTVPAGPGPDGVYGNMDDTPAYLIPSFYRPQLMREFSGTTQAIVDWDRDANTSRRIFRPHIDHQSVDTNGVAYSRYLQSTSIGPDMQPGVAGFDDDGINGVDDPGELGWPGSDDVLPFPFSGNGPDGQPGVAGVDDDGINGVDDPGEYGYVGSDDVQIREGIWTNDSGSDGVFDLSDYAYDIDTDGDGIKDAIWIPLGFPVQECDGKRFVPLFAFSVRDLDGLLNLDVAGNTAGTRLTGTIDPSTQRFNQSNQALTPSELSLHYAFSANPLSVLDTDAAWNPYKAMFGINPATINRQVLANMETFMLLHGRGVYTEPTPGNYAYSSVLLGRYGDRQLLEAPGTGVLLTVPPNSNPKLYPQPGQPLVDDDQDDTNNYGIFSSNDPTNATTFTQPLDILGVGSIVNQVTGMGTLPNRQDIGADPFRGTVQYLDYEVNPTYFAFDDIFANLMVWTAPNAAAVNFNIDEADEIVLIPGYSTLSGYDAAFSVAENAALHKNDADPDANLISSRLRDLLGISLDKATASPGFLAAAELRKQFTTISWDRIEFALKESLSRPWETDNSAIDPDAPDFPPLVGGLAGGETDPDQPFRQPVIELFSLNREEFIKANLGRQRRLDLNRHLYYDSSGNLDYRELTPHPEDPGSAQITPPASLPNYDISTATAQEYWARLDRQEKARDIYVLLYALCGGPDVDPLTAPSPYTTVQLQQMAQFAVNVVDALDSDNVITKFEYDTNLSNGWNVDDNAYSTLGDLDRAEVFGVEAATLTFSEALVFHALHVDNSGTAQNHNATQHDDRYDWLFTYLELRNASSQQVETGRSLGDSTIQTGGHWRIRIETTDPMTSLPDPAASTNTLTLFAGPIAAGDIFTIGSNVSPPLAAMYADPNRVMVDPLDPLVELPTHLLVNPNYNPGDMLNFQQIVPRQGTGPLDLDLSLTPEDAMTSVPYRINAGDVAGAVPIPGTWDNVMPVNAGGWFEANDRILITFVLERRANLTREAPLVPTSVVVGQQEEDDNPWVEVDRIKVDRRDFNLEDESSSSPATVQAQLANLQSFERNQPFGFMGDLTAAADVARRYSHVHPAGNFSNTIGDINESTSTNLPNGFTSWQPHFDRHFASVMELLSIPLYSSAEHTAHLVLDDMGMTPQQITNPMGIQVPPLTDRVRRRIAQEKFLFPDHDGMPATPPAALDNRWHRLFSFVEIPSKLHRGLGDVTRVPGKLNLNTIRHPGVLGAPLDAPLVFGLDLLSLDPLDTGMASAMNRNWWSEFLAARDTVFLPDGTVVGPDPVTGEYVPGVAGTRPFREHSHVDHGNLSVEHTVLRQLISDIDGRGLFEVGPGDNDPNTDSAVDQYMRHRLLSKVANHATTRSHVFAVFIAVDFFEVVEDTPGQPQIGGKLATSPGHRGFFIVDVSDPFQAGAYTPPTGVGTRGRFDFNQFVRYRRTTN